LGAIAIALLARLASRILIQLLRVVSVIRLLARRLHPALSQAVHLIIKVVGVAIARRDLVLMGRSVCAPLMIVLNRQFLILALANVI
jgi:hypothetical protein